MEIIRSDIRGVHVNLVEDAGYDILGVCFEKELIS